MNNLISESENWEGFLKKYISPSVVGKEWDLIIDPLLPGCYGFQLFNKSFCDQLISISEEKGNWASGQRQSNEEYETYDILLEDVGFDEIYNNILIDYVYPAVIHSFHLEAVLGNKSPAERFHAENFIAKYTPDNQSHLSLHHDFSQVTTLVALNEEFKGGGTWFPDHQKLLRYPPGYMVFHPGMFTHYHGARPISEGKRYILVTFNNWCP